MTKTRMPKPVSAYLRFLRYVEAVLFGFVLHALGYTIDKGGGFAELLNGVDGTPSYVLLIALAVFIETYILQSLYYETWELPYTRRAFTFDLVCIAIPFAVLVEGAKALADKPVPENDETTSAATELTTSAAAELTTSAATALTWLLIFLVAYILGREAWIVFRNKSRWASSKRLIWVSMGGKLVALVVGPCFIVGKGAEVASFWGCLYSFIYLVVARFSEGDDMLGNSSVKSEA